MEAKKADWILIKSEYMSNVLTLRQLAKKHGVCASTICERAKREGWQKDVQDVQTEANKRLKEAAVNAYVTNGELAMAAGVNLLEKTKAGIANCKEKDVGALKGYASVLKDLKDMGIFTIATEDSNIKIEIGEKGEEYAD